MPVPDASTARSRRRHRTEAAILEAALDVFALHGFRGATLDQIAEGAGMSKPNLLYYFASKEEVHARLLGDLLDHWLAPLRAIDPGGEPVEEAAPEMEVFYTFTWAPRARGGEARGRGGERGPRVRAAAGRGAARARVWLVMNRLAV